MARDFFNPKPIRVGINAEEIKHFDEIKITQSINNHHYFTIKLPQNAVEGAEAVVMQKANHWIGALIHVELELKNDFLGIVEKVWFEKNQGHTGGKIVLSGRSKTVLLDGGKDYYSWEDVELKKIVEQLLKKVKHELQHEILPEFKFPIEYETQYGESDFAFLQRMAKKHNEWFFYNGEKLFFGKPTNANSDKLITLVFNKDLLKLKYFVRAKKTQFGGFTYNDIHDELYQVEPKKEVDGLPKDGEIAFKDSQKIYQKPSFEPAKIPSGSEAYLGMMLKAQQQSAAANTNYIIAKSRNRNLRVGSVIGLEAATVMPFIEAYNQNLNYNRVNFKNQHVGFYIITEISHKVKEKGRYKNKFKALPAFIKKLPEPEVILPLAQIQEAVVRENNDPKNLGRVRVQMAWQKLKNSRTPWIRVSTPDAGASGNVNKNRGLVFVPEVGDHVMVGFRYGDPNRPYVIGSVFTGKSAAGGGANNNIKSITLKNGSTITFNETQKSILIKDPSGNTWLMDGAGNINVTAPQNFTINAQNISFNALNNITSSAAANILENAGTNKITNVAALHNLTVDGDSVLNVKGKLTEMIEGDVYSETKQERSEITRENMDFMSDKDITKNSEKKLYKNSGEQSYQY